MRDRYRDFRCTYETHFRYNSERSWANRFESALFCTCHFDQVGLERSGVLQASTCRAVNKDFRIFKFRSMRVGSDKGSLVTIGGHDPRITRSGYFIRKFKFDELPQLINVFIGDMSLVGPRPEVRHYVDYWTPEQMHVLDVRPGITDPASIKFRNENELMEKAEDPEKYYIEVIMQEKIKLYLEYVEKHSFFYDISLIFKTFGVIVSER